MNWHIKVANCWGIILHATLDEYHEDHDEVVNTILRESMEAYEVKPVTITKSSIDYWGIREGSAQGQREEFLNIDLVNITLFYTFILIIFVLNNY